MTDIPGTGKLQPLPSESEQKQEAASLVSVVNVSEIKKKKSERPPEENLWYMQLKYWLVFGLTASIVFVVLSLINWRFLLLTPLGPIVAIISWYVRRLFLKYAKIVDAFSK